MKTAPAPIKTQYGLRCPKCGQEGGAEWMTNHYNTRSGICETTYLYGEPDVREQLA